MVECVFALLLIVDQRKIKEHVIHDRIMAKCLKAKR